MAAPNTDNIYTSKPGNVDGASGGVLTAATGTTMPGGVNGALTSFADAGYISEDGLTMTIDKETQDIRAWGGDKVRVIQTGHSLMFTLTLLEVSSVSLGLVFGADNVTATTDGYSVDITNAELPHLAWVFDTADGDQFLRIEVPDGQVTDMGDVVFVHSDAAKFEVTIEAYPDSAGVKATLYYEEEASA